MTAEDLILFSVSILNLFSSLQILKLQSNCQKWFLAEIPNPWQHSDDLHTNNNATKKPKTLFRRSWTEPWERKQTLPLVLSLPFKLYHPLFKTVLSVGTICWWWLSCLTLIRIKSVRKALCWYRQTKETRCFIFCFRNMSLARRWLFILDFATSFL